MYKLNGEAILRKEDGAIIPRDPANRDYAFYLEWEKQGNEPEAEFSKKDLTDAKKVKARAWRDAELVRADIQLVKAQDGMEGFGTEKEWREYRITLRNWPATRAFPKKAPVAPDAGV